MLALARGPGDTQMRALGCSMPPPHWEPGEGRADSPWHPGPGRCSGAPSPSPSWRRLTGPGRWAARAAGPWPTTAGAAERQPIEQDEGQAEHGQLQAAAHCPDKAGPEQQHEGQPAVVGASTPAGRRGRAARTLPRLSCRAPNRESNPPKLAHPSTHRTNVRTHNHMAGGWPGQPGPAGRPQSHPPLATRHQATILSRNAVSPWEGPALGWSRQCPYHHGDEGTHAALVHDEVAQAAQRRHRLWPASRGMLG